MIEHVNPGDAAGVLIVDATGFLKHGASSGGVQGQDRGMGRTFQNHERCLLEKACATQSGARRLGCRMQSPSRRNLGSTPGLAVARW
jgi:hypothetical protein